MIYINPQTKKYLENLASLFKAHPPPNKHPFAPFRDWLSRSIYSFTPKSYPLHKNGLLKIPGPAGEISAQLLVPRNPKDQEQMPVMIYFHGGGFSIGSAEEYHSICSRLAVSADCIVIVPDYRLAPEHKHPAALDDCKAVYKWVLENAHVFNGDPQRIALVGDSAGGTVVALLTLYAKENQLPQPKIQIMAYAVLDVLAETVSFHERDTKEDHFWRVDLYLQDRMKQGAEPEISPVRAKDLSGVAPAVIIACEGDWFRDESRAYAAKLRSFGVPAYYYEYEGQVHDLLTVSGVVDEGRLMIEHIAGVLRHAFSKD